MFLLQQNYFSQQQECNFSLVTTPETYASLNVFVCYYTRYASQYRLENNKYYINNTMIM